MVAKDDNYMPLSQQRQQGETININNTEETIHYKRDKT